MDDAHKDQYKLVPKSKSQMKRIKVQTNKKKKDKKNEVPKL